MQKLITKEEGYVQKSSSQHFTLIHWSFNVFLDIQAEFTPCNQKAEMKQEKNK